MSDGSGLPFPSLALVFEVGYWPYPAAVSQALYRGVVDKAG